MSTAVVMVDCDDDCVASCEVRRDFGRYGESACRISMIRKGGDVWIGL